MKAKDQQSQAIRMVARPIGQDRAQRTYEMRRTATVDRVLTLPLFTDNKSDYNGGYNITEALTRSSYTHLFIPIANTHTCNIKTHATKRYKLAEINCFTRTMLWAQSPCSTLTPTVPANTTIQIPQQLPLCKKVTKKTLPSEMLN